MKSKRTLLIISLCISFLPHISSASTLKRLTSYAELVSALQNGHRVNLVADNSKCTVISKGSSKDDPADADNNVIVGFSFNSNDFLIHKMGNHRVVSVITTYPVTGTEAGNSYRYKRALVLDDNSVEMYASQTNFVTGERMSFVKNKCTINNGKNQGDVSLFDYDSE